MKNRRIVGFYLALSLLTFACPLSAQTTAADYLSSGIRKGEKGDLDGAITDFNKAIELDPKDAIAYNKRGSTKGTKGDLDGAIADYTKAIELDPKYATAYYNRGQAERRGQVVHYSHALLCIIRIRLIKV